MQPEGSLIYLQPRKAGRKSSRKGNGRRRTCETISGLEHVTNQERSESRKVGTSADNAMILWFGGAKSVEGG